MCALIQNVYMTDSVHLLKGICYYIFGPFLTVTYLSAETISAVHAVDIADHDATFKNTW